MLMMMLVYCLWKKKNWVVYFDFLQIELKWDWIFFLQICSETRIWKKLNRIMKKGKKNWLMKIYEFSGFFFSF